MLGATPTVPSQVITTFPANGAASQPVNVTLQWRTASGAAFYRVQLATDSTFTNLVVNDSSLTDTARAVGPLTNNTLYYWRVNARNAVGDGPYSTRSSFTTIVPLPSQVNLVSPVNGATNQPVNLTLRWRATPGVAFYRVQLATDSAFTNLILNDSSLTDTARTVGPLSNNTLYYWRVNARNAAGDGPFSTVSSFTTIVSLPSQVNLVSPVNGATIGADSVRCLWGSSSPSVTNYWFERSADSMFTNTLIDSTLTDTSKVTRGLLPNTSYWWRVRARNVAGWGVYSIARRFVTLFTDVGESLTEPLENALMQNYPNPFNPTTTISFSIPSKSFVSLKVFDALGREVSSLLSEELSAGKYSQQWNAEGLASGVYLYRLQAGSFTETKKLMLLR